MSHPINKVKWCLNKAQKEIKEGKKHRGLLVIKPDIGEAKRHIEKAQHNFKAIDHNMDEFPDWSVSAAFYTIYHCFLAISAKFGYESRNQECTIALIEYLEEEGKIEISKEIIDALKTVDQEEIQRRNATELRENFQYGTETKMEDSKLNELKELCRKAIEEAKDIIYKK